MTQASNLVVLPTLAAFWLGCQVAERSDADRMSSSVVSRTQCRPGPTEALDGLDTRRTVPLLPMMAWHQKQNMMAHLVAVQQIVEAVAHEDWAAVARASAPLESTPDMRQTCQHMGAGAAGFTDLALDFHDRADAIGVAARARDRARVLSATSETLKACTNCHATFRQEVVDDATWRARAKGRVN